MIKTLSILFILSGILVLWNYDVFANGGDQRVVDGKYLINLSRSPFTPRVGVETSFLASFVDIAKDKLVGEELIVKVRIAKLGGIGGRREFIFEKDNVKVEGGVMDFKYIFAESGLHEIFFDFAFASNLDKVYVAPDFLLDVQESKVATSNAFSVLLTIIGIIAGFIIGYIIRSKLAF